MINKKGQALVEFVLLLPIIMLLISGIIDFINISIKKYALENHLDTVVEMYKNSDTKSIEEYLISSDIEYNTKKQNNFMTQITVNENIKINTPILSNIIGKNYKVESKRTIYAE